MQPIHKDMVAAAKLLTEWLSDPVNYGLRWPSWNEAGDPLSDLYARLLVWRTHQSYLDWDADMATLDEPLDDLEN